MSRFDRYNPHTELKRTGFEQILTSWFLEPHAKAYLSVSCTKLFLWKEVQDKMLTGTLMEENFSYLPLFYQGKIPSPSTQEVYLSFRRFKKENWKYGYVLIREKVQPEENSSSAP
jgi:hypothetical protein